MKLGRRLGVLLAVLAAVAAALAASVGAADEAATPRAAALFTQNVSQGGWDPGGYAAFKAMAKKYGFETTYVEQASYEKAPAILRDLASKGYDLIITHSSGYAPAIEEIAPDFPDTEFVLYSYAASTKGLKNYSAWSMDWNQFGYIVGALAGLTTKSNHIAAIGGVKIPSGEASINTMRRGALAVNKKVKFTKAYVGSWTDVAKAKEIATQVLNQGADFLLPSADTADAGIQQAAEENGAFTFGEYVDQAKAYPKSVVTSAIVNFNKAYDQIGKAFKAGTLNGQIVQMNIAKGDLYLKRPFRHVAKSVEARAVKLMRDIAQGRVKTA
jgi:basic membrane protein A